MQTCALAPGSRGLAARPRESHLRAARLSGRRKRDVPILGGLALQHLRADNSCRTPREGRAGQGRAPRAWDLCTFTRGPSVDWASSVGTIADAGSGAGVGGTSSRRGRRSARGTSWGRGPATPEGMGRALRTRPDTEDAAPSGCSERTRR